MLKKRRKWRMAAFILVSLALILVLVMGLAYGILRSPAMQQRILTSLQSPLAKLGVDLKFESLSIDLLAGVNLQKLDLSVNRPPELVAKLNIAQLRLGYSWLGLLQKSLRLSEVSIEGLQGEVNLTLPASPPPLEPASGGLGALLELLRHPPLDLAIDTIDLHDTRLKLHLVQGSKIVQAQIDQAELHSELALQGGLLELTSKLALKLNLNLEQTDAEKNVLKLQSNLEFQPDLQVKVQLTQDQLQWLVTINQAPLSLVNSQIFLQNKQGSTTAKIAKLSLNPSLEAKREGGVTQEAPLLDVLLPLKAKGSHSLEILGIELEQKSAAKLMQIRLDAQSDLNWDALLKDLSTLDQQKLQLGHILKLSQVAINQNGQLLAATAGLDLSLRTEFDRGTGRLSQTFDLLPLQTPQLKTQLAVRQELSAAFTWPDPVWQIDAWIDLNGQRLLDLVSKGKDAKGVLEAQSTLQLVTQQGLQALHAGAEILGKLGWPKINVQLATKILHPKPFTEWKPDQWLELTITSNFVTGIKQQTKATTNIVNFENLTLKSAFNVRARTPGAKSSELQTQLQLTVKQLEHVALKRAIDFEQNLQVDAQLSSRIDGKFTSKSLLNGQEIVKAEGKWEDAPGLLMTDSKIIVEVDPGLQSIHEGAKALEALGALRITSQQKLQVGHGFPSLLKLTGLDPQKVSLEALVSQLIDQKPSGLKKSELIWPKPISIDTRITLKKSKLELINRVNLATLIAQSQARVQAITLLTKGLVENLQTMEHGEIKVVGDVASVELLQASAKPNPLHKFLRNFKLIFDGKLEHKNQLTIKTLFAEVHGSLLQFKGQGKFKTSGQGHFDGQLESQLEAKADMPLKGSGRLQIPISLIMFDKSRLLIKANPRFQNFSLQMNEIELKNLNGAIRVHEELGIDAKKRVGFLYLVMQNPFARVDYESLEPYVDEQSLLSFDKVKVKHIEIGPLVSNFEIRQNLISLNDLKLDLLQGSALGRFYLDLHPERLKLGFLGRFSGLKTELLKDPRRRTPLEEWADLSGRMAMNFDIRKRLASGRLDLTSIGQKQLLSLLDVLDPDYKDDQMLLARRGLRVAYPKGVAVAMDQGLMDLNISLGGAISKDIDIRSIPLTAFINAHAGELFQNIEKTLQSGVN